MEENNNLIKDNESLDDLQLNNLKIIQKKDGFRFGVDAVLLANFAKIKAKDTVVDLCSGTGIIPFIIAGKKNPRKITGIEIQKDMVEMSNRSSIYNNIYDKVNFFNCDLKDEKSLKKIGKFDVLTVNPPYKLEKSGLINTQGKEAIARHEILCNLDDVIKAARLLLKDNGSMYMVHRPERIADILCTMRKYKIEPKVLKLVYPSLNKAPNIILIEGKRDAKRFLKWDKPLYIHNEDGSYTEELNKIYGK